MVDPINNNNNDGNFDLWLLLIMIGVVILNSFKHYDDNELENLPKSAKLRRVITGGIGSAIVVFLTYEVLCGYTNIYPRLALGISGLVGYIGAEAVIVLMEDIVKRWVEKKLGLKPKKDDDERRDF